MGAIRLQLMIRVYVGAPGARPLSGFYCRILYRTFAVGARGLLRLLLHEGFSAAAFSLRCREATYSFPSWLLFFRCCHYANTWLISSQALKFCQYHEYCIQNVYFIVIKSAFSSDSCFADFSCACESAFSSDSCFAYFLLHLQVRVCMIL